MLPKSLRLSRKGFEHQKGLSRTTTPHFTISYGPVSESGGSAIIVPKKVVKSAVGRHFLKRRIRSIIRTVSAKNRILIISARSGSETLSFKELEDELSTALTAILGKHL